MTTTLNIVRLLYRRFVRRDTVAGGLLWAKAALILAPNAFRFTPEELAVIRAGDPDRNRAALDRVLMKIGGRVPR